MKDAMVLAKVQVASIALVILTRCLMRGVTSREGTNVPEQARTNPRSFPPNLFSLFLKDTYLTIGQYCVMASMKKGTWPKHSEEVGEVLVEHISHFPAQRKVMFGAPCYFVNGNMFAGVFSDKLFARFSALDRAVLVENGLGDVFEPVPGRAMREYRTLSKVVMDDQRALDDWLGRSYAYVSTLKPKDGKG